MQKEKTSFGMKRKRAVIPEKKQEADFRVKNEER